MELSPQAIHDLHAMFGNELAARYLLIGYMVESIVKGKTYVDVSFEDGVWGVSSEHPFKHNEDKDLLIALEDACDPACRITDGAGNIRRR
jgi:hypothetical protein